MMTRRRSMGGLLALVAAALVPLGCNEGVDAAKATAYFDALQKQSDYVADRAQQICGDSDLMSQHSAIQGLLRDLNQYRVDFEAQATCTQKRKCDGPKTTANPPPVFRAAPEKPDPTGASLSKDTFAKLRAVMGDKPPRPFCDALAKCQTEAMSVAAAAAVLVTTCATNPGSEETKRDTSRLAKAREQLASALAKARSATK